MYRAFACSVSEEQDQQENKEEWELFNQEMLSGFSDVSNTAATNTAPALAASKTRNTRVTRIKPPVGLEVPRSFCPAPSASASGTSSNPLAIHRDSVSPPLLNQITEQVEQVVSPMEVTNEISEDPFCQPEVAPRVGQAMSRLVQDYESLMKSAGKTRVKGTASQLFKECRIVIVMSQKAFKSLGNKWLLLLKHGGIPIIRYDSKVTHIVVDPDVDEGAFLRFLGVASRASIAQNIEPITYDWISTSIRTQQRQPLEPFLVAKRQSRQSRPSKTLSLLAPQMQVVLPPTRSLSDSSRLSTKQIIQAGQNQNFTTSVVPGFGSVNDTKLSIPQSDNWRVRPQPNTSPGLVLSTAEQDDVTKRSELEPGVPADPLDKIILGIKEGTIQIPEDGDGVSIEPIGKRSHSDIEESSHSDDSVASNDNGKVLRAQARKRANELRSQKTDVSDGPYVAQQAHDGTTKAQGINDDIAAAVEELAKVYKNAPYKNAFEKQSYSKVANLLRNTPYRIKSGQQALEIKGIGQRMADRIQEAIDYGRTLRAAYEDTPESRARSLFGGIYGVGPTLAGDFVQKGARSLQDLRDEPGKYKLSTSQLFGLEHYDDLQERIPRAQVTSLYERIKAIAISIDADIQINPMGSYRRGEADSGDLDIMVSRDPSDGITHSGFTRSLLEGLAKNGLPMYTLSAPHDWTSLECKWMGAGRESPTGKMRRIDILCVPFDQLGAALIYFTGNERFNRSLRYYANRQGYSLNQRGLFKGVLRDANRVKQTEGTLVASRTEQEIFDVLKIRWRPPHLRRP